MVVYNGTLLRGTANYSAANAKFGSGGLSGAAYNLGAADSFLGSNGSAYGTGTIEAWVKNSTTSVGSRVVAGHDNWYWFGMSGNNAHARFGSGGAEVQLTSTVSLTDGAWHHLALVFNTTSVSLYVDGNRVNTSSTVTPFGTSANGLQLAGLATGANDWQGAVDEVRFSNIARYSGTTLTVPTAAFTTDANTVALYRLEVDATDYSSTPATVGTISVTSASGNDTITYPAPVAGSDPIASVSLYRGTTSLGESATALLTNASSAAGTFVTPSPSSGNYFYFVRATDTAARLGPRSNEVMTGPTPPTIGTITASSSGTTDTITYPAPVAGTGPGSGTVSSVSLFKGTSSGGESGTAVATNASAAAGTFTYTRPTTGSNYYYVKATDSLGLSSAASNEVQTVPPPNILPNDANIVYSPYNWLVTAGLAKTINAGAYLRAAIIGSATQITALFDLDNVLTPLPQISYRVDQGAWQSVAVAQSVQLTIPTGNTWAKHTIELVVKATTETQNRWASPQNTAVKFLGFLTNPTTATTAITRTRKLNILCYGDSITEGVRTLNSNATNDTDRNDSRVAWAHPLYDLLGAEVGVVGFGGSGVSITGSGGVPGLETSYNQLWASQARTFTPAPDLVLVHTGTNGTGVNYTPGMTTFLNGILAATPGTTLIGVMPNWLQRHLTEIQAAIAACNNPRRVKFIDTTGWYNSSDSSDGLHPYGYINQSDLAPRVAIAARTILAAGGTYLNVGGTAKLISPRVV